ncbi:hypothetical protein AXK58_19410 [Tsukamurella tyrosinosolvens]|nr:hypothetical protein AXK58_19410 [Tsukamurella tyrosinosolvens]
MFSVAGAASVALPAPFSVSVPCVELGAVDAVLAVIRTATEGQYRASSDRLLIGLDGFCGTHDSSSLVLDLSTSLQLAPEPPEVYTFMQMTSVNTRSVSGVVFPPHPTTDETSTPTVAMVEATFFWFTVLLSWFPLILVIAEGLGRRVFER